MDPHKGKNHKSITDQSHLGPRQADINGYQSVVDPKKSENYSRQAPSASLSRDSRLQAERETGDSNRSVPPAAVRRQSYQSGGLLQSQYPVNNRVGPFGRDSEMNGNSRYGATDYRSSVLPLPIAFISTEQPRHHLPCTILLMVLCGLQLFIPAFVFLIPALAFSLTARRYSQRGQFEKARRCGIGAFCCGTTAVLAYIFALVAAFVVLVLWMTGVISCSPLPQDSIKVCMIQINS